MSHYRRPSSWIVHRCSYCGRYGDLYENCTGCGAQIISKVTYRRTEESREAEIDDWSSGFEGRYDGSS